MSNLKINPFGFREYDARWLYEKDINRQGITNLGKGFGTQIIDQTKIEDEPKLFNIIHKVSDVLKILA